MRTATRRTMRSREHRIPWPPSHRRKLPRGIPEAVCLSELGRATGITVSYASRIFSGERRPSLPVASKIAKYLGMSIDKFYGILTRQAR